MEKIVSARARAFALVCTPVLCLRPYTRAYPQLQLGALLDPAAFLLIHLLVLATAALMPHGTTSKEGAAFMFLEAVEHTNRAWTNAIEPVEFPVEARVVRALVSACHVLAFTWVALRMGWSRRAWRRNADSQVWVAGRCAIGVMNGARLTGALVLRFCGSSPLQQRKLCTSQGGSRLRRRSAIRRSRASWASCASHRRTVSASRGGRDWRICESASVACRTAWNCKSPSIPPARSSSSSIISSRGSRGRRGSSRGRRGTRCVSPRSGHWEGLWAPWIFKASILVATDMVEAVVEAVVETAVETAVEAVVLVAAK